MSTSILEYEVSLRGGDKFFSTLKNVVYKNTLGYANHSNSVDFIVDIDNQEYLLSILLENSYIKRIESDTLLVNGIRDLPFYPNNIYKDELLVIGHYGYQTNYDIILRKHISLYPLNVKMQSGDINNACVMSFLRLIKWFYNYKITPMRLKMNSIGFDPYSEAFIYDFSSLYPCSNTEIDDDCCNAAFYRMISMLFALKAKNLAYLLSFDVIQFLIGFGSSCNEDCLNELSEILEDVSLKHGINTTLIYNYLRDRGGDFKLISKELEIFCSIEMLLQEDNFEDKEINCINNNDYDVMASGSEDRTIVRYKVNGLYGFCNFIGKLIITPQYDDVRDFEEGFSVVRKNDLYGIINRHGDSIIPIDYDDMDWYSEYNIVYVSKNGFCGLLNREADVLLDFKYRWIGTFSSERAIIQSAANQKMGYIDTNANVIVEPMFDDATSFFEGIDHVKLGDNWYDICLDGKFLHETR